MKKNLIVILVIALIIVAGVAYWQLNKTTTSDQVACTEEAKICPDGSSVSRQGPNCEFAECPVAQVLIEEPGIFIDYPKDNEVVKFPIKITGYITGKNGWTANEGEVGNVVVLDNNGKTISNIEILKSTTDWLKLPTYFEATVGDREMMSHLETDSGKLVFTAQGAKDNESVKKFEVNIRFK